MATTSALETLIELATKETDEAARRQGRAMRTSEEAQHKLTVLEQYRDDYILRFQESLLSGLTALSYRNFQSFIEKIDNAISGQQEVVMKAQQRVADARTVWQMCERKRMSYGTLATRAQRIAQLHENRRDQKQTDEHAARSMFYKQ
ncbi:MAG: flagellar export protein FliJ [Herbaspirillum sp.]